MIQVVICFCLLFLLCSIKKIIGIVDYVDGILRGGQGLCDDVEIVFKNGCVVSVLVVKDFFQFLVMLENLDFDVLDFFVEIVEVIDFLDLNMFRI